MALEAGCWALFTGVSKNKPDCMIPLKTTCFQFSFNMKGARLVHITRRELD